jgi:hypothetical protein
MKNFIKQLETISTTKRRASHIPRHDMFDFGDLFVDIDILKKEE